MVLNIVIIEREDGCAVAVDRILGVDDVFEDGTVPHPLVPPVHALRQQQQQRADHARRHS
jgi:hypothetical protein|tara:strand:+ start:313 stop:492 length:180 start_codon:yes stop_codon:yes gene_type:complete